MSAQGKPHDLRSLCAALAAELGEVEAVTSGSTTEYRRRGRPFAVVDADGRAVEVRLNPEVAEAARRTPATAASSRAGDWVRLSPKGLAGHDLDRAEAWFRSAWRAAAGRSS